MARVGAWRRCPRRPSVARTSRPASPVALEFGDDLQVEAAGPNTSPMTSRSSEQAVSALAVPTANGDGNPAPRANMVVDGDHGGRLADARTHDVVNLPY